MASAALARLTGLCACLVMVLAGCTPLASSVVDVGRSAVAKKTAPLDITAQSVARTPYYQLLLDSDTLPQQLLILGNVDDGRQAWYSADKGILFIEHGLVTKTWKMGTAHIVHTELPPDSPLITGLARLGQVRSETRHVDLEPYSYGVPVHARFTPEGEATLRILDSTLVTQKVVEEVSIPALDFKATNYYWVDPADNTVLKSRQTLPGGVTLTLTQLKPYREGAQ